MNLRFALALSCAFGSVSGAAVAAHGQVDQEAVVSTDGSTGATSDATEPATAPQAQVADAQPAEPPKRDWEVSTVTYLWASGIHGTVGIRGDEAEVHQSFIDLLGDLKFGFMGALDVRYKRFVSVGDVIYTHIGVKAEPERGLGFTSAKVTTKMFIGTLVGGYRVVDRGPMFVDLLAGGRLTSMDVNLKLHGPLQTRERDISPQKLTPVLGARMRVPLGGRWGLGLYTDFGVTDSSVIRWQAVGTVQYEISGRWRAALGWRHMDIHHDKTVADIDLNMTGPFLGFICKL